MFEDLKKNIEQEKKIIADVQSILSGMKTNPSLRTFYLSSLSSLMYQLNLLNKSVPELLKEESPLKKFTEKPSETKKEVLCYGALVSHFFIILIRNQMMEFFLRKLKNF